MNQQDAIPRPSVLRDYRRSWLSSVYMYMVTWLLRIIVSYLSGPNEGHDQVISVPTPGLGAGQVRCNIWTPHAAEKSPSRPLILMLEGGGFVLGHPKDGRRTSRLLAEKTGAIVISIDYAKAPRYPYPHALLQAHEVLKWAVSQGATTSTVPASGIMGWRETIIPVDPTRVAISGNSAGGNLAAALTLLVSFTEGPCSVFRRSLPPHFRQVAQLLLYPSLELNAAYGERLARTSSPEARAKSLPAWMATMMESAYLPPAVDREAIFVAPTNLSLELLAELRLKLASSSSSSSFPSSVVLTGGWDCLKEEGKAYADKLLQAGVAVIYKEFPRAVHGFSHSSTGRQASYETEIYERCWETVCQALEDAFLQS